MGDFKANAPLEFNCDEIDATIFHNHLCIWLIHFEENIATQLPRNQSNLNFHHCIKPFISHLMLRFFVGRLTFFYVFYQSSQILVFVDNYVCMSSNCVPKSPRPHGIMAHIWVFTSILKYRMCACNLDNRKTSMVDSSLCWLIFLVIIKKNDLSKEAS